jgi:deoxyribodipyrimidine photo-lyase
MLNRSLFIFRRDLRLNDNTGLLAATAKSKQVIPLFIIDPALMRKWQDAKYRMEFLATSLADLDDSIAQQHGRLAVLEGDPATVVANLLATHKIDGVFINRDYTPLSIRRDRKIRKVCQQSGVKLHQYADQLLNEPELVSKADGRPYSMFTPYFRQARTHFVHPPICNSDYRFDSDSVTTRLQTSKLAYYLDRDKHSNARHAPGVHTLLSGLKDLGNYETSRDIPGVSGTSKLSAHLRFGTCSVRQVYHAVIGNLSATSGLIRQLYWRDFYSHIGFHFPHVYQGAFRKQYDDIIWDDNPDAFRLWCEGKTGFPIVDAGQRELLATGFMHNRVRMVAASLLTKNLHIDWRLGERHFANLLVDFDPASNNGNWQWSASTGCDAQPYFRVFNPWRQQKRFDSDCTYIKTWIPELSDYSARSIHGLEKRGDFYISPIADLPSSSAASKERFKAVTSSRN